METLKIKSKYKVGDLVKVIDDWYIIEKRANDVDLEWYKQYIGQLGIINFIGADGKCRVKFNDSIDFLYKPENLTIPTEYESDKFWLERYKYV